tara:strand:- start:21552 stop:21914 length:363 start_codon:yes stop_codon:yes gene_type:complete
MRTGLLLKENGEIDEIKFDLSKTKFSLDMFDNYTDYIIYDMYVVLYNKNEINLNINIIPFTDDKFNGDILLLKLNNNGMINNFSIDSYIKIISKIKPEENDLYYSSDEISDIEDRPLFSF